MSRLPIPTVQSRSDHGDTDILLPTQIYLLLLPPLLPLCFPFPLPGLLSIALAILLTIYITSILSMYSGSNEVGGLRVPVLETKLERRSVIMEGFPLVSTWARRVGTM
ncbi:hypothetical protein BGX38DRAFT_1181526 [Terfezia claveryi]|nr:hypothetical protein BGX38DRAFT_1181526 [Terfezia claveryi]